MFNLKTVAKGILKILENADPKTVKRGIDWLFKGRSPYEKFLINQCDGYKLAITTQTYKAEFSRDHCFKVHRSFEDIFDYPVFTICQVSREAVNFIDNEIKPANPTDRSRYLSAIFKTTYQFIKREQPYNRCIRYQYTHYEPDGQILTTDPAGQPLKAEKHSITVHIREKTETLVVSVLLKDTKCYPPPNGLVLYQVEGETVTVERTERQPILHPTKQMIEWIVQKPQDGKIYQLEFFIPLDVREYQIETSPEIDAFIQTFSSLVFLPRRPYDAHRTIIELFRSAKNNLIVVDPWVNIDLLDMLREVPSNIPITILTTNLIGGFKSAFNAFKVQKQAECLLFSPTSFHDRYIILDLDRSKVYSLGPSIKDAGWKKIGHMARISDEGCAQEIIEIVVKEVGHNPFESPKNEQA